MKRLYSHEDVDQSLQRIFLWDRQIGLSEYFLKQGIAEDIVGTARSHSGNFGVDLSPSNLKRLLFVPRLARTTFRNGEVIEICLSASALDSESKPTGYLNLHLGKIEDGGFEPRQFIPQDAADVVIEAARGLVIDKSQGFMPDLASHLLSIGMPDLERLPPVSAE